MLYMLGLFMECHAGKPGLFCQLELVGSLYIFTFLYSNYSTYSSPWCSRATVFIIHSSVGWHWGCFLFLLVWIEQQCPWLSMYVCQTVLAYAKAWQKGSYHRFTSSSLRILHTDFHSGCSNLLFHQLWMRGLFSPQSASICCFVDLSYSDWGKIKS